MNDGGLKAAFSLATPLNLPQHEGIEAELLMPAQRPLSSESATAGLNCSSVASHQCHGQRKLTKCWPYQGLQIWTAKIWRKNLYITKLYRKRTRTHHISFAAMVGIAGRSKACGACYKRRIKCDEARPTCNRCSKARIHCPGYKDASFVSFQAGKSGLQRLKNVSPFSRPMEESASISIDSRILSCQQDDFCISYARSRLPQVWYDSEMWKLNQPNNSSCMSNLQANLVQYVLISLARTLFAYRYNQEDLLNEGFGLYRQVLGAMQQSLGETTSTQRLDLLEAILALRAFDSLIPYHKGAWIHHSFGVERLLQLRGPHAHKTSRARRLLERARPFVIMACLAQGQSTILSLENWKSIPWSERDVVKSHQQRLIDIFVDLPEVLYGRSGSQGVQAELRTTGEIRTLGIALLHRLQAWRQQWDAHYHGHFAIVEDVPTDPELQPLLWLRRRLPLSLEQAETLSLYHAFCLILLSKAFSGELESIECFMCIEQHVSNISASSRHSGLEAGHSQQPNIEQIYHKIMPEACDLASYYWSSSGSKPQPVDVLIPLRHVWLTTRCLRCPMAVWLDDALTRILKSAQAGLPLWLHYSQALAAERETWRSSPGLYTILNTPPQESKGG